MRIVENTMVRDHNGASQDETEKLIEISLLDGFEMRHRGLRMGPRELGGTKPRLILEVLLLRRGAPVSKDALVDLLWEGAARHGGSHANLETYVCVLRRRLHERLRVDEGLICTIASGYALDTSRVVTDVDRMELLLGRVLHPATTPRRAAQLLGATPLAAGTLLFGEPDLTWVEETRANHVMHIADLLVHAAHKVIGAAPGLAETCARMAIDSDELNEQAWYLYLLSLREQGRPAEAVHAYSRLRRLLADQLGCAPSPEIRDLYDDLLRATSERDDDLGPLLDALLTVHRASGGREEPTATTRRDQGQAAGPVAVEAARRALLGFLGAAGNGKPYPRSLELA